ncbi:hypothetical protein [Mucilaginibacter paludis]|nr:hypothetical protein [Mucilaginibacter paludis]
MRPGAQLSTQQRDADYKPILKLILSKDEGIASMRILQTDLIMD